MHDERNNDWIWIPGCAGGLDEMPGNSGMFVAYHHPMLLGWNDECGKKQLPILCTKALIGTDACFYDFTLEYGIICSICGY